MGYRLSLVWELGEKGSGGRTALSLPQQGSADFLRTKQSGERALGEGGQAPPPSAPTLMMGEREREPAFYFCSPGTPHPPPLPSGFFSLTGLGQGRGGEDAPHCQGSHLPAGHICANQEPRAPPPGSHSPLPGGPGAYTQPDPPSPAARRQRDTAEVPPQEN